MRRAAMCLVAFALPSGLLATGTLSSSCGETTCEQSCTRAFTTCGFDYALANTTTQEHIDGCIDACRLALELPSREAEAVTWALCIETYPCELHEMDPNGFELRAACPPDDYYLGDLTAE